MSERITQLNDECLKSSGIWWNISIGLLTTLFWAGLVLAYKFIFKK